MPAITRLRGAGRNRVAVELDGLPWRTLPLAVVARAGLAPGVELDRPSVRLLRNELRRAEAIAAGARALESRDRTTAELAARLARAGIDASARVEAVETLQRVGALDDGRYANARAAALAARGYGNDAIRDDLEQRGVGVPIASEALAALEPEAERAGRIIARRGAGAATVRYLARRGFGDAALEDAGGGIADDT